MSLQSFIEKVCSQTFVYWEFEGMDGYSSPQYAAPIELSCRWDDETQVITTSNGVQFVSTTQALVTRDLVERSQVYLGTIADIENKDGYPDPGQLKNPREIRSMNRHPEFGSSTFDVFIMYL